MGRAADQQILPQVPNFTGGAPVYPVAQFSEYFHAVPAGYGLVQGDATRHHLDYSLQLAVGIRSYCVITAHSTESVCRSTPATPPPSGVGADTVRESDTPEITRDGSESDPWAAPSVSAERAGEPPASAPPEAEAEATSDAAAAGETNWVPLGAGVGALVFAAVAALLVRLRRRS